MKRYDAIVVGGGPAGSTTAYRLAEQGASVLLADKATFPRDKPCGGGVTGRAARLLPFSIAAVVEDTVSRMDCGLRYRQHVSRTARKPMRSRSKASARTPRRARSNVASPSAGSPQPQRDASGDG